MNKIRQNLSFTAVESLAVLAIIVIFILVTSLLIRGARNAAGTVGCINNLRKMYIAIMLYSDDHRGGWVGSGEENIPKHTTLIWDGEKKCWLGVLYDEYLEDLDTFYCPLQHPGNRPSYGNKNYFGKTGKKCCSDYKAEFLPGNSVSFTRLRKRVLAQCGGQDIIPNPHRKNIIMLRGDGSVTSEEE